MARPIRRYNVLWKDEFGNEGAAYRKQTKGDALYFLRHLVSENHRKGTTWKRKFRIVPDSVDIPDYRPWPGRWNNEKRVWELRKKA